MPTELDEIYRPPATSSETRRRPRPALAGYTPLGRLTWAVALFVGACALISALRILVHGYTLWHLDDLMSRRSEVPTFFEPLQENVRLVAAVALLAAAVTFLTWVYRLHRNIPALGKRTAITPMGAVLHYFFPFMNFVRPFQHMMAAWRLSSPTKQERDAPSPIGWWWLAWIGRAVLGSLNHWLLVPIAAASFDETRQRILFGGIVDIVLDAVYVVAAALCISVTFAMTARQERAAERRHKRARRKRRRRSAGPSLR